MRIQIENLLVVALLTAPFPGRAADVTPPAAAPQLSSTEAALNKSIEELRGAFAATQQCFETEASLRADRARKQAQLSAEFKGKIPPVFNDLLWAKTERIARQHQVCVQRHDDLGRQFDSLLPSFQMYAPKGLDVEKQRALVDALWTKYRQMRPPAKPPNNSSKSRPSQ